MSPEDVKKLREKTLAEQQAMMEPGYTEPGIEEESELSIANLPKKQVVGKLRESGMPVAAELVDIAVPEADITSLAGKGMRAGSAVARAVKGEQEAATVWNKLLQKFRGQSTEKLEQLRKLPIEQQKEILNEGKSAFEQWQKGQVAGKRIRESNPIPGMGQGEVDLGEYWKQASSVSSVPVWKQKLEKPK